MQNAIQNTRGCLFTHPIDSVYMYSAAHTQTDRPSIPKYKQAASVVVAHFIPFKLNFEIINIGAV